MWKKDFQCIWTVADGTQCIKGSQAVLKKKKEEKRQQDHSVMIYQSVMIAGNKTLAQLPALPLIKGTESSQYRITYLIC